jgi:hypothetical protein
MTEQGNGFNGVNDGNKSPLSPPGNVVRHNVPRLGGYVEQLPTGYPLVGDDTGLDSLVGSTGSFWIPSCGIEDVDIAVVELFDQTIGYRNFSSAQGTQRQFALPKPFVKFAGGERFAVAKKLKPFRDKNGVLILPAISVRRTGLSQESPQTFQGEMTIKRHLSEINDIDLQALLNPLGLNNLPSTQPTTSRANKNNLEGNAAIKQGMLLASNLSPGDHIYEIIKIPFPQSFDAKYEIVFWTTEEMHMNYLIETTLASQLAPGKSFYLKSQKGYWFNAILDAEISSGNNSEDMTDEERIVRNVFTMTVKGMLVAPTGPGQQTAIKRYISNPTVTFETEIVPNTEGIKSVRDGTLYDMTKEDQMTKFSLSQDVEENPTTDSSPKTTNQQFLFRKDGRFVKEMSRSQKHGETVYTASDLETLNNFFIDGGGARQRKKRR